MPPWIDIVIDCGLVPLVVLRLSQLLPDKVVGEDVKLMGGPALETFKIWLAGVLVALDAKYNAVALTKRPGALPPNVILRMRKASEIYTLPAASRAKPFGCVRLALMAGAGNCTDDSRRFCSRRCRFV
jgi:hypothetical protein